MAVFRNVDWQKCKGIIDIVSGLAVIATMLFIALQWHEIKEGGKDTHALAESAKIQAETAGKQADAAKATAEATNEIAKNAITQAAATNELAKQAKRSADYALQSRAAAERQARIAQRAWLVSGPTSFSEFNVPEVLKIKYVAKNNGRTPAVNVRVACAAESFSRSNPEPMKEYPENEAPTMVRADGESICELKLFPLDDVVIRKIRSGELVVRIHGRYSYEDVFRHHHWMKFCFLYSEGDSGFIQCANGNGLDNDSE